MQENISTTPDELLPDDRQEVTENDKKSMAPEEAQIQPKLRRLSFFRAVGSFILIMMVSSLIILMTLINATMVRDWLIALKRPFISWQQPLKKSSKDFRTNLKNLDKRLLALQKRLEKMTPVAPYLIIDTSDNTFSLMKGNDLIRKGTCSTGSYTLLKTEKKKQQWIFKTPRGMFRIQTKVRNPVWHMPDWAFVEEGRPIPPPDSPDRFEYGVLGDYALTLGDGYMIHGTLYQRFLGLAVTHGCVRIGDEDLSLIFKSLQVDSKVYIY
jgi:L,D-transpeptidase YbiS